MLSKLNLPRRRSILFNNNPIPVIKVLSTNKIEREVDKKQIPDDDFHSHLDFIIILTFQ